jgi:hypothetical protein
MRADHDTDPTGQPARDRSDEAAHVATDADLFAMADEQTIPDMKIEDIVRARVAYEPHDVRRTTNRSDRPVAIDLALMAVRDPHLPNREWRGQPADDGELTSNGALAASVHLGPHLPPKSTDVMLPTESVVVPLLKQTPTVPMARQGRSRTPVVPWSPSATDSLGYASGAPAPRKRRTEREMTTGVVRRIRGLSRTELATYIVVAVVFAAIGLVLLARSISSGVH